MIPEASKKTDQAARGLSMFNSQDIMLATLTVQLQGKPFRAFGEAQRTGDQFIASSQSREQPLQVGKTVDRETDGGFQKASPKAILIPLYRGGADFSRNFSGRARPRQHPFGGFDYGHIDHFTVERERAFA